MVRVVPREGHGQIEAQSEIGEVVFPMRRDGFELGAALQDLEDELLVLPALAAQQEPEALERRRLDAPEPVRRVRRENRRRRAVAELHLSRQQIPHSTRRRRLELHRRAVAEGLAPTARTEGRSRRIIARGRRMSGSGDRGDACRSHSPVVTMIWVSAMVLKKFWERTTAMTSVGIEPAPSPGIAPSAVTVPSKPEFTVWNRYPAGPL